MSESQYTVVKLLGEGGFGKVFLIQDKSDPTIKQALKLMEIGSMDDDTFALTVQEIKLLSELEHEYVLSFISSFVQDDKMCIVTEFCPNGDLSEYIQNQQGNPLEELRLIEWFRQISSAIEYIHGKNIIHRDLKAQNIFLDANMNCKLGDFGIARVLDPVVNMAQTQIGTPHYMSPEIFMGIGYNAKTDIWSLSILIYELATLEKPFDALFLPVLMFKITRGEKPDMPTHYRPEFTELLSKMMEKDPKDRPSAREILQDKLFKKQEKPKPMQNLKSPEDYSSNEDYELGAFNIHKALKTIGDTVPGRRFGDKKPARQGKLGHVKEEGEAIASSHNRDDMNDTITDPVMEQVTRTLKDMGHNTLRPAGKSNLQQQADLLKMYILNVLGNDQGLFDKASRELDKKDEDEELEEKLIRILGHEKYGLCGVELLHYKNFTYNLKKIKQ